MCYVKSLQTVLVIGGYSNEDGWKQAVEMHLVAANTWEQAHDLNVPRSSAGSCHYGRFVYTFCGMSDGDLINSIERLPISAVQ